MQDIPMFVTQSGVATLILKKIPYTQSAYIILQDSGAPDALLNECVDFCVSAGAQHIYASGNAMLERYPQYATIWRMTGKKRDLPKTDATLQPANMTTIEKWRSVYNEKMLDVPNAAYMSIRDSEKVMNEGKTYFVYLAQTLIGIGLADCYSVEALAATVPGAGQDVLLALSALVEQELIHLTVASSNIPAVKLYQRLGFELSEEGASWYKII